MPDSLFVYGTLAPGGPNSHVLSNIGGTRIKGSVRGFLHEKGWGSAKGFPGIEIDNGGDLISGFVISSPDLKEKWRKLDAFEGEDYKRVLVDVLMEDGTIKKSYIYELKKS